MSHQIFVTVEKKKISLFNDNNKFGDGTTAKQEDFNGRQPPHMI